MRARFVAAFFAAIAKPVYAAEWYEGGTLQSSTLGEWRQATEDNRLATSADFAAAILKGRVHSMEELKPQAQELETCINEAAEVGDDVAWQRAVDYAGACATVMGWRG